MSAISPVKWNRYIQDGFITMQGILHDADISIRLPHTLRSEPLLRKWVPIAELILLNLWQAEYIFDEPQVDRQMDFLMTPDNEVFYRGPMLNKAYPSVVFSNLYAVYGRDSKAFFVWTDIRGCSYITRKEFISEFEILNFYLANIGSIG